MKHLLYLMLSCMILFSSCKKSSTRAAESTEEQWLYTLTGEGLIIDAEAKTMTIVHANDELVAFTDRPIRKTYITTPQWMTDYWNSGDDSFKADPPNAELSYFNSEDNIPVNLVLDIFTPSVDTTQVPFHNSNPSSEEGPYIHFSFTYKLLGNYTVTSDTLTAFVSLFIDDAGTEYSDDDNDTCNDYFSGTYDVSNDGPDYDGDGLCDAGDPAPNNPSPNGQVSLFFADSTKTSANIIYTSTKPIGGYQFRVNGVVLSNVDGSPLQNVSYNDTSGMVIGFDLTGTNLPATSIEDNAVSCPENNSTVCTDCNPACCAPDNNGFYCQQASNGKEALSHNDCTTGAYSFEYMNKFMQNTGTGSWTCYESTGYIRGLQNSTPDADYINDNFGTHFFPGAAPLAPTPSGGNYILSTTENCVSDAANLNACYNPVVYDTLVTLYFKEGLDSEITLSNLFVSNSSGHEMQVNAPPPVQIPACADDDGDGVCNKITGCLDPIACNYNQNANTNDDSCQYAGFCNYCSGANDGTGTIISCYESDVGDWGETCYTCLSGDGCTSSTACNYNTAAETDNGSCIYPNLGTAVCEFCSGECSIAGIYTYFECINTFSNGLAGKWTSQTNGNGTLINGDNDGDGVCDYFEIVGCMSSVNGTTKTDASVTATSITMSESSPDSLIFVGMSVTANNGAIPSGTKVASIMFDQEGNNPTTIVLSGAGISDGDGYMEYPGNQLSGSGVDGFDELYYSSGTLESFVDDCIAKCNTAFICGGFVVNYNDPETHASPNFCEFKMGSSMHTASAKDSYKKSMSGAALPKGTILTFSACNFNENASDSGDCIYAVGECESCSGATNGTGTIVTNDSDSDGTCDSAEIGGCMDSAACNYNLSATDDDFTCMYATGDCETCSGTTNGTGTILSNDSNGNGVCDDDEVYGCTDPTTCNFNPNATQNDSTCETPGACYVEHSGNAIMGDGVVGWAELYYSSGTLESFVDDCKAQCNSSDLCGAFVVNYNDPDTDKWEN